MKREEVVHHLETFDPEIYNLLQEERQRQRYTLSLMPNMNAMSPFAKYLEGSILTNSFFDRSDETPTGGLHLEAIVRDRAKQLFHRPSRQHRRRLARRLSGTPRRGRHGALPQPAQKGSRRGTLLPL